MKDSLEPSHQDNKVYCKACGNLIRYQKIEDYKETLNTKYEHKKNCKYYEPVG